MRTSRKDVRWTLSVARDAEDTDLGQARGFHFGPPAQMTSCSCREEAAESSLMVGQ